MPNGNWSLREALTEMKGRTPTEHESLLGAFVLVAHGVDGASRGGWSYATVVARPSAGGKLLGAELDESRVYPLKKRSVRFPATILVGRADSNDVCIDSQSVSKLHARMKIVDGAIYVEDAGSRNGTMVEGEAIRKEVKVALGETITFGSCELVLYTTASFREHLLRISSPIRAAR